jgi:hypothetical protein
MKRTVNGLRGLSERCRGQKHLLPLPWVEPHSLYPFKLLCSNYRRWRIWFRKVRRVRTYCADDLGLFMPAKSESPSRTWRKRNLCPHSGDLSDLPCPKMADSNAQNTLVRWQKFTNLQVKCMWSNRLLQIRLCGDRGCCKRIYLYGDKLQQTIINNTNITR